MICSTAAFNPNDKGVHIIVLVIFSLDYTASTAAFTNMALDE